jgi:hypothetical protein
VTARALACAAALAIAGCGEGSEDPPESTPAPEPAVEALDRACGEYRAAALAELPPAAPSGYRAYVREQRRLADELVAAVREQPSEGPAAEPRGRLLAASSEILGNVNDIQRSTGREFSTGALYHRALVFGYGFAALDEATGKTGLQCGRPPEPSAALREFRTAADEVCADSGATEGLPSLDAALIRARVDGHGRLPLPADATELERETLAAERALAGVAAAAKRARTIQEELDARYVALAVRASEGWRRQGAAECVDLPQFSP